MNAVARVAARTIDLAAIAIFTAMFFCVAGQVFFRYVLGDPLVWSDELARYLLVWCAFLGWVIAARRRSHLGVSMWRERMPARAQGLLALFGALCNVAFAALLVYYGWQIMIRNLDVSTTTLFFSAGVVYTIVPFAALAVAVHGLADARSALAVLTGRSGPAT